MLLSLEKKHAHTENKQQQNKQQHIIAPVYITGGDGIRQLL